MTSPPQDVAGEVAREHVGPRAAVGEVRVDHRLGGIERDLARLTFTGEEACDNLSIAAAAMVTHLTVMSSIDQPGVRASESDSR
jgi:hypothetical protein